MGAIVINGVRFGGSNSGSSSNIDISELRSQIDEIIQENIEELTSSFNSEISDLKDRITEVETLNSNLESRVKELEDLMDMIFGISEEEPEETPAYNATIDDNGELYCR